LVKKIANKVIGIKYFDFKHTTELTCFDYYTYRVFRKATNVLGRYRVCQNTHNKHTRWQ
jgi:hypothetical protein